MFKVNFVPNLSSCAGSIANVVNEKWHQDQSAYTHLYRIFIFSSHSWSGQKSSSPFCSWHSFLFLQFSGPAAAANNQPHATYHPTKSFVKTVCSLSSTPIKIWFQEKMNRKQLRNDMNQSVGFAEFMVCWSPSLFWFLVSE